jgi:transcriptional regulator with XRE-family HTH domain
LYNKYNIKRGPPMATGKQFGEFFRASRKALGLTLRDLSQRNGFDPGNVSRLERGLVAPPQAQRALESYAKALKLKRGTDQWERFFALAAAATGRIPQELLQNEGTAGRLPSLFRRLGAGPGHRNWVTARHLEEWAKSLTARAQLPQLIRRLVHATGNTIIRIEFPAGEQIQRPGFDGVVEAAGVNTFVSEGRSVWELSAEKDPGGKAERDFTKRRKQAEKNTTYVFVTPREWQKKDDWMKAKEKLGVWKDVRVYDSATLEEWLERAPAVDVWLARLLELRPEGLTDIDEYWANLEALTEPSLKPEVFLTSRAKEAEELKKWLKGQSGAMVIKTRSPSEAIDFVAALSRDPDNHDAFAARTLIVDSKEAWRAIARSDSELVLIAHPTLNVEPEMVAEAVRQGHRVILSSGQVSTERASTLELPRVSQYDLQKALASSGLDHTRAGDFASNAGGSLTVLKRLLGRFPGTAQPTWSRQPEVSALVPVLLAGGWEETCDGDRQALERLSNRSYHELSSVADRWSHHEDPPIAHVLARWDLVSRDDSWHLLAYAITQDHLQRFEAVALDVLGENDPAYELLPDERWLAKIKQKVLAHSQVLRTGLAETLALLGGRPEQVHNAPDLRGRVGYVVRTLLDTKDWKRWASLSPQLPLLAEASPDAFLDAVERDLRRKDSGVLKLFEQEGGAPFSSCPHTGLLWALEGLAWDRTLLPRVSFILAQLDELVPPGQLANRPMKSLHEIFMAWFPQTTAPVEERVKVLSAITKKSPAAGWRLLLNLLPDRFGIAAPIRRPSYRDWALAWTEGATNADNSHQVNECANMLVDLLGRDLDRWKELIKHFENLPGPAGSKFLEQLQSFDVSTLDSNSRRAITEALRAKVCGNRRFSNIDRPLPEKLLTRLEQAQRRFEPEDVVTRHAWLFDEFWRVQGLAGGKDEAEITELRRASLREVEGESGWDGVLALAEAAPAPRELGALLGDTASTTYDAKVLPGLLGTANRKISDFAQGYVWRRFREAGWDWVKGLKTAKWSARAVGEVALFLPLERQAWELVTGKGPGAEEHFWRNTGDYSRSTNPEEIGGAVSMLLKYHRPFHACFVLRMAPHNKCAIQPGLVMDVLEAGLKGPVADSDRAVIEHEPYHLLELVQELQKGVKRKDPAFDPMRVAKLEYGYLGLFDGHPASPDTLHGMLKNDPTFFVDLLHLIFRSGHEPEEARTEPSEEDRARAQNAFRLLMSWQSVPGSRVDKTVDEDALFEWIQRARSMAEEQGRLEVCDVRIGNVLAYAPFDQDGSWPCIPVRDAIEDVASDDLASGFEVGIYNKRGAYRKSPEEGGDQERSFANRYQDWAQVCKIEWPRTAASLRRVADGYAAEARREDAARELRW